MTIISSAEVGDVARKRIDIGYGELISALATSVFTRNSSEHFVRSAETIGSQFADLDGPPLVCLSVRSGFDLLFATASKLYLWPDEPCTDELFCSVETEVSF